MIPAGPPGQGGGNAPEKNRNNVDANVEVEVKREAKYVKGENAPSKASSATAAQSQKPGQNDGANNVEVEVNRDVKFVKADDESSKGQHKESKSRRDSSVSKDPSNSTERNPAKRRTPGNDKEHLYSALSIPPNASKKEKKKRVSEAISSLMGIISSSGSGSLSGSGSSSSSSGSSKSSKSKQTGWTPPSSYPYTATPSSTQSHYNTMTSSKMGHSKARQSSSGSTETQSSGQTDLQQQQQQNNCCADYVPHPLCTQIGILPPRAAAFQAPYIHLPKPHCSPDGQPQHMLQEDEDGLKFSFNPRANFATEVSFTVEPRKKPVWQTMMKCGFTPVIYCSVPPCCLPGNQQQPESECDSDSDDSDDSGSESESSSSSSESDNDKGRKGSTGSSYSSVNGYDASSSRKGQVHLMNVDKDGNVYDRGIGPLPPSSVSTTQDSSGSYPRPVKPTTISNHTKRSGAAGSARSKVKSNKSSMRSEGSNSYTNEFSFSSESSEKRAKGKRVSKAR